jgi:hypothetical protein
MKKKLPCITILILTVAITILLLNRPNIQPLTPIARIDSLQNLISTHQQTIDSLKTHRDTIRDTITDTRTIRVQVPKIINHLPPDSLIATFNNLTKETTILLETGEALTPLPAIRQSTIALTENPLLKKEITLLEELTLNQHITITAQDSIIQLQEIQKDIREKQVNDLDAEVEKKERKVKVWKYVAGGAGVIAIIAIIF